MSYKTLGMRFCGDALHLNLNAEPLPFLSYKEVDMERKRLCVRVNEACELLSMGRTSLFKSDIPYIKINGLRLYRIEDLEAYLEAHIVKKGETA